jgi:nucleoid-associated protein YgaU
MAVRQEDLSARPEGVVYAFPVARVRRAASRERMLVRRRRSLLAAVALVVVVFGLLAGPRATAPASRPGTPRAVTVRAGDTLWDLATRYAPEGMDARAYLDAIIELNGLGGSVPEGTRIRLPK